MQFGEFEIFVVSGGRMSFDGGAVFGVVPKTLWARYCPADEQNLVRLDTNCVVVRSRECVGLIETGYGTKVPAHLREHHQLDSGDTLLDNLARSNISPADVGWVTLTHLHFDHAGGCTSREDGKVTPVFPRAQHYIQQAEWEDATGDLPELAGTYFKDDFEPLADNGLVQLVDERAEPTEGVSLQLTGGHTRGYQVIFLQSAANTAVYLGDLCPTPAHVKTFWTSAFDQSSRSVRRSKLELLGRAADEGWLVLFGHDVRVKAAYLKRDRKGNPAVDRTVDMNAPGN